MKMSRIERRSCVEFAAQVCSARDVITGVQGYGDENINKERLEEDSAREFKELALILTSDKPKHEIMKDVVVWCASKICSDSDLGVS